jgi:hypothetical protein
MQGMILALKIPERWRHVRFVSASTLNSPSRHTVHCIRDIGFAWTV